MFCYDAIWLYLMHILSEVWKAVVKFTGEIKLDNCQLLDVLWCGV